MQRVYSGDLLADVAHAQNLLEREGIESFIKHAALSSGLGDLPFLDCQPELWVYDDAEAPRALRVLQEALGPGPRAGTPWTCRRCGEINEPQLTAWWSCGADGASS
jgi:hypothetical protein